MSESKVVSTPYSVPVAPERLDPIFVQQQAVDGTKIVVLNSNLKVESLERFQNAPSRIRAQVKLNTVESFCDYMNRHKSEFGVEIFVSDSGGCVGVLDYHTAPTEEAVSSPDFCEHRATYSPQMSNELQAWRGNDKKPLTQVQFCEFIEANEATVVDPLGATLLEIISALEGKSEAVFSQAVRLQNGTVRLTYNEEVQLNGQSRSSVGQLELPTQFRLGLRVFQFGQPYEVIAKLKYRITNRTLTFTYTLQKIDEIFENAVGDIVTIIKEETELPVVRGTLASAGL